MSLELVAVEPPPHRPLRTASPANRDALEAGLGQSVIGASTARPCSASARRAARSVTVAAGRSNRKRPMPSRMKSGARCAYFIVTATEEWPGTFLQGQDLAASHQEMTCHGVAKPVEPMVALGARHARRRAIEAVVRAWSGTPSLHRLAGNRFATGARRAARRDGSALRAACRSCEHLCAKGLRTQLRRERARPCTPA